MTITTIEPEEISSDNICHLCGEKLDAAIVEDTSGNCPTCGSRARIRTLWHIIAFLMKRQSFIKSDLPLLAFAMTLQEKKILSPVYKSITPVSLDGNYGKKNSVGIDARDLHDFAAESFSGYYGCLLFDYFEEHAAALKEANRVLAPGGLFLIHIAPGRITPDGMEPQGRRNEKGGCTIKVGYDWFVSAMREAGMTPQVWAVPDEFSGKTHYWFAAIKPLPPEQAKTVQSRKSIPLIRHGSSRRRGKIMLTVDVEARPSRARQEHIDTLIYGRFGGVEYGIGRMMTIAERYDAKMTFFVDYASVVHYGNAMLDVAAYISTRGHSLQVHTHPGDYFPHLMNNQNLYTADADTAEMVIRQAVEAHLSVPGTSSPIAVRGGGYRFNQHILNALKAYGIRLDCSYNPIRENTSFRRINRKSPFAWECGVYEIPVPVVSDFPDSKCQPMEFNFNAQYFQKKPARQIQCYLDYLESFNKQYSDDAIAALVMHSWSLLLPVDEEGYYYAPDLKSVIRFEYLVSALSEEYDILTAEDALSHIEHDSKQYEIFPLEMECGIATNNV